MEKTNSKLLNDRLNNDRLQVRQSNFITQSRHDMSAIQQNIMYMVMAQIGDNDPKNALYPIHLNELEKLTGSQINYKYLRSAFEKLEKNLYKIIEPNKVSSFAALTSFIYCSHLKVRQLA